MVEPKLATPEPTFNFLQVPRTDNCPVISVVVWQRFDADPDPTFHFEADPNPTPKIVGKSENKLFFDFHSLHCHSKLFHISLQRHRCHIFNILDRK